MGSLIRFFRFFLPEGVRASVTGGLPGFRLSAPNGGIIIERAPAFIDDFDEIKEL